MIRKLAIAVVAVPLAASAQNTYYNPYLHGPLPQPQAIVVPSYGYVPPVVVAPQPIYQPPIGPPQIDGLAQREIFRNQLLQNQNLELRNQALQRDLYRGLGADALGDMQKKVGGFDFE